MRTIWVSYVAAVALLAGASQAVAQANDAVKAAPAPSASATPSKAATAKPAANTKKKLVNINAASREELKALPGGSDAEADRIIAGRPYNSKAVLVTNNVISDGRYAMIKSLVVAGDPAAKPAKPAKTTK